MSVEWSRLRYSNRAVIYTQYRVFLSRDLNCAIFKIRHLQALRSSNSGNEFMQHLSSYAEGLPPDAKERYIDNISIINGTDPLLDRLFGEEVDVTPPVDASDLVSYLVLQTSFVTAKQFKARKGLEAYNQFVCGWVKEINTRKVAGKYLTTGRVSLSHTHI